MSVKEKNLISNFDPELYDLLCNDKNMEAGIDVDNLSRYSCVKVYIWCQDCESYDYQPARNLAKGGFRCTQCALLKNKDPALFNRLDREANQERGIDIDSLTYGSTVECVFIAMCGHNILKSVNHAYNDGISTCSDPACRVKRYTSLQELRPDVADQWDYDLNTLSPDQVSPYSEAIGHFICGEGHRWKAPICQRTQAKNARCPVCYTLGFQEEELASEWHPTNNGDTTPWDVTPQSRFNASWVCNCCGHVWSSRVYNRVRGHGCPSCAAEQKGHWTLERIRHFIKDLIPQIKAGVLHDAQKFTLFDAAQNPSDRKSQDFIDAFTGGRISTEALQEFVDNPGESKVDQVIEGELDLDEVCVDPYSDDDAKDAPEDDTKPPPSDGTAGEAEEREDLPGLRARTVLQSVEGNVSNVPDDVHAQCIVDKALNHLWNAAFEDEAATLREAGKYDPTGEYDTRVKQAFLSEYASVLSTPIPEGYNFRSQGKLVQPNLMQRLVAYRATQHKYVGNWSGAGAGKTLAFVIASRMVGPGLYVVVCPNDVLSVWETTIKRAWSDNEVAVKTWEPPKTGDYRYVVLNYSMFQKMDAVQSFLQMAEGENVRMLGLDEMHRVKKRGADEVSTQRKVVEKIFASKHDFKVMGMTATPVINDLVEPKSMLDLLSDDTSDLDTGLSLRNAVNMHYGLIRHGVRYVPEYTPQLDYQEKRVDCTPYLDKLKATRKGSMWDVDRVLTVPHLEVIIPELAPKTIVYSYYIKEIRHILEEEITNKTPFSVGFHDGDHKDDIDEFIHGDLDVLIASSSIDHGIDGLQDVCAKLVINSLPWTNAQYEQLIGRIYRQGQRARKVEVVVPVGYIQTAEGEWSWDRQRINHIKHKESLADCVINGSLPASAEFMSLNSQLKNAQEWLNHIDEKLEAAAE